VSGAAETGAAALLAAIAPAAAAWAACPIGGPAPPLRPSEQVAVAGAVPKRQREVAFGRACARRALAALGVPAADLPAGPDRAPIWPAGLTGSITHTDDVAAAIASRDLRGVGLDLESVAHAARTPDLLAAVTTGPERRRLGGLALPVAALVFSAKESVYKCLYPLGRRALEFGEVELELGEGTFTVLRAAGYAEAPLIRGRYAIAEGLVATVASLGR
jgi:4'-phosphopantetheinyl transferase EntD